ncbi:uncharacterized protein LOC121265832 [Juglans microcarpa x Juglans regia]|uniref:uncharacterized protein LOC121265832 n=1 Tax=Juglans microcarpa x Juglans regia TaxID=2249226 RepID=UPI001B7E4DF4|nr:uncharacterized protein LOC121265832 [Juglans microcarpa x Juglans regia]
MDKESASKGPNLQESVQAKISEIANSNKDQVLLQEKKYGAALRPYSQMEAFRLAMEECELSDLGYMGDRFTWRNNREGQQFTKERLDRGLANSRWQDLFPSHSVSHEIALCSDHRPIVINVAKQMLYEHSSEKPFRYEASWALREDCLHLIKEEWKKPMLAPHKLALVTKGLQRCQDKLKIWAKANFGNTKRSINNKLSQLSKLQESHKGERDDRFKSLSKEVEGLLEEDNLKWKQRAKQRWLQEGDRNTKYFHQCANQGRTTNSIQKIINDEGKVLTNPKDIGSQFQKFFSELFSTECPSGIEVCLKT